MSSEQLLQASFICGGISAALGIGCFISQFGNGPLSKLLKTTAGQASPFVFVFLAAIFGAFSYFGWPQGLIEIGKVAAGVVVLLVLLVLLVIFTWLFFGWPNGKVKAKGSE